MCMQLSLSRGDKWDPSPSDETVDLISSLDRPAFEVVNFDFPSPWTLLSRTNTQSQYPHTRTQHTRPNTQIRKGTALTKHTHTLA